MAISPSPKESQALPLSIDTSGSSDLLRLVADEQDRVGSDRQVDLVFCYRPDGSLISVNQAMCTFFGRRSEELIGGKLLAFVPSDFQERYGAHQNAQANHPRLELSEYPFLAAGGHLRWLRVTEYPLYNAAGQVLEFQAVARDVTEQKMSESGRLEYEAHFRTLVENSPALLCRFNSQGRFTYVNETFCGFMGYSREDLLGREIFSLVAERQVDEAWAGLAELRPGQPPSIYELEVVLASGEHRWCRWITRTIEGEGCCDQEHQAVGIDITARRRVEAALRRSEQRYREFLTSVHLIAVQLDLDWTLAFCNDFFLELTGYQRDEVLGKNWLNVMVPAEERDATRTLLTHMVQAGEYVRYGERHILTRQGEQLLISWNTTLLRDEQGQVIGITSLGEDITGRIWAEKVQEITQRIAQGAASASTVEDLYVLIHSTLAEVMSVENFFISLYDRDRDEISFPYFVDQHDQPPAPHKANHGLTEYILRSGKAQIISPDKFDTLVAEGEVLEFGAPCVSWLGVPLKIGERTIGVMVVQSYSERACFGHRDLLIMDFVSTQVAMTIERKRAEHRLRENEAKYRALVEASSSSILLVSCDGNVFESNNAACQLLGYRREEFLKLRVEALFPAPELENQSDWISNNAAGALDRVQTHTIHKDGSLLPVEISTRRIEVSGQPVTVMYLDDISERKRREREMETVAGVSAALRTAITQSKILAIILQQLVDRLKVHGAFITLMDASGWSGRVELGCGTWTCLSGALLPSAANLCSQVHRSGKMYINNEAYRDPLFPFAEYLDGVRAMACVPMITQGQTLGSLTVGYERPIQDEELAILVTISDIAASAIQRALLYEQTSRQAEELSAAYDATIEGWALALELRDKETQGHSRRVTDMTLRLASVIGLGESDQVHIRRGVLLHDIGKMGIPDSILLKPGPLTPDEWLIMRKHPEYAYKMLSSITYLHPALDIPYCHHEKWDGSGYPRGLKAEQIPLYARLFAVVDVMDALTSARPYRPAWAQAEALTYIISQRGYHFDPAIVDAFLRIS